MVKLLYVRVSLIVAMVLATSPSTPPLGTTQWWPLLGHLTGHSG